jgi:hypothetical protein
MVWLKAGILEQTNEDIARLRRNKHIIVAADTDVTTEDICCPCQGYTGCPRRNVPDFGRVFLMLKYDNIMRHKNLRYLVNVNYRTYIM